MNEAETRAELIDPLLVAAGWGVVEGSRIRREYPITLGRLEGGGRRGKPLTADYVLEFWNTKLATVEAKAEDKALTEGVGQTKGYAEKLALRFCYASNGRGIYGIDRETGEEGEIAAFPSRGNSGTGSMPRPTPGATASPPFPSRTGAVIFSPAITRTSPSSGCCEPWPTAKTASC
jgi:type I restriction enzyme R subunit